MARNRLALIAAAAMAWGGAAVAREPGVPLVVPPGNTMGVAIGANPPPGFYLGSRNGYWDAKLRNDDGDDAGQSNRLFDSALQGIWVPGSEILGGSYRALVTIPFIHNDQTRSDPFPPPLQGSDGNGGVGPIEISPIGLSWQIQPGIFASAALSFYTPVGGFDAAAPINIGGDFWTVAPSLGFSYLRDGWNLSASAAYFISAENRSTDYKSGDELLVNATAFKDFGGWSVGPVGYWRKQMTADSNNGADYGGTTQPKSEQVALGLGASHRFGPLDINLNVTRDVYIRDTVGGDKIWLNFTLPLAAPR